MRHRNLSPRILLCLALATPLACAGDGTGSEAPAPNWQGEIVTDGDHTTTTTFSGSVWTDQPVLVEQASIGVLEGDEKYMFGDVISVTATAERILVADRQIPVVRAYDWSGAYLHDIGGVGDGPGEYRAPYSVRTLSDDRVLVRDDSRSMVHLYDAGGAFLESWPTQHRVRTFTQTLVTPDDRVFVFTSERDGEDRAFGFRRAEPDGLRGELLEVPTFDFEPTTVAADSGSRNGFWSSPWFPREHWTFNYDTGYIAGVSNEYRFEVRRSDGTTLTVVREGWSPAPISDQERADGRAAITTWARDIQPDWTWDLPLVPEIRPVFRDFVPSRSGAIWVVRPGPAEKLTVCEGNADIMAGCWRESLSFDLFDDAGRFLGNVAAPPGYLGYRQPYIDGDDFIAVVQDDDGTVFVKRYKLERPEITS